MKVVIFKQEINILIIICKKKFQKFLDGRGRYLWSGEYFSALQIVMWMAVDFPVLRKSKEQTY